MQSKRSVGTAIGPSPCETTGGVIGFCRERSDFRDFGPSMTRRVGAPGGGRRYPHPATASGPGRAGITMKNVVDSEGDDNFSLGTNESCGIMEERAGSAIGVVRTRSAS